MTVQLHVTVIAKEPRPGAVKTRLCPPCTPEEAAAAAAAALVDTLDAVDALALATPTALDRVLLFEGDPVEWLRPGWRTVPQRGGGLDDRLANGFRDLGPGVIVGMETPHVVPAVRGALEAIACGTDAIGLAVDGGYWAVGLHAVDDRALQGVPMSTSHTGIAQLRRLHQLGRSVRRLPLARDLDTFDDLVAAARRVDGSPTLRSVARDVTERVLARSGPDGRGPVACGSPGGADRLRGDHAQRIPRAVS